METGALRRLAIFGRFVQDAITEGFGVGYGKNALSLYDTTAPRVYPRIPVAVFGENGLFFLATPSLAESRRELRRLANKLNIPFGYCNELMNSEPELGPSF
jgi:hypothetical protein